MYVYAWIGDLNDDELMGAAFQRSIGRLPTLVWMHPFLKVTKLEFMELSPFPLRTCYKCMYVLLKNKSYHCMHRYLNIYNNGYHCCVQAPLCRASQPKAGISGTVRTIQSIFFYFSKLFVSIFLNSFNSIGTSIEFDKKLCLSIKASCPTQLPLVSMYVCMSQMMKY